MTIHWCTEVQHGTDADADDDEPVPGQTAAVGQPVYHCRRGQPAEQGTGGHGVVAAAQARDHHQCTGVRARVDADDVGTAERVAGERLEDRSCHAEGGSDQQRHQHARHPPLEDDHAVEGRVRPEQHTEDVGRRHGILAETDLHEANQYRGEQQRQHDRSGHPC
jgi:hypothetical protein